MNFTVRAIRWAPLLAALAALLVLALGRGLTDRFWWSQYLYWTPAWLLLTCASVAVIVYAAFAILTARRRAGRVERAVRWVVAVSLALACAHACVFEYRLTRYLTGRPAGPKEGSGLRVLVWNAMGPDLPPGPHIPRQIIDECDPDVFFFASRMSAPGSYENTVKPLGPEYYTAGRGVYIAVSRFPIISQRLFTLGLNNVAQRVSIQKGADPAAPTDPANLPPPTTRSRRYFEEFYNGVLTRVGLPPRYFRDLDPGHLYVLTLDTTAKLGRPITVWYIDLPSDPVDSKRTMAALISQRLGSIRKNDLETGAEPLAAPDMVLGDFNLPRGSGSIGLFAPGLANAFDQAGRGISGTWPRAWPTLQIDQVLLGPGLRAFDHRVRDMGSSDHLAVIVDLQAAR